MNVWEQGWVGSGIELAARVLDPPGVFWVVKGFPTTNRGAVVQLADPGQLPNVVFSFILTPDDRFPYGEVVEPDN